MEVIKRRQTERFRFLNHLYDRTHHFQECEATSPAQVALFLITDLADELRVTDAVGWEIAIYLHEHGLVECMAGNLRITHKGQVEVEEKLTNSGGETENSPAHMSIFVTGDLVDSPIQQGTAHSSVSVSAPLDLAPMMDLLAKLKAVLPELPLDAEDSAEVSVEVATVEAQLQSPRPKKNIIKLALATIKGIIQGVVIKASADAIRTQLPVIIAELGQWLNWLP